MVGLKIKSGTGAFEEEMEEARQNKLKADKIRLADMTETKDVLVY